MNDACAAVSNPRADVPLGASTRIRVPTAVVAPGVTSGVLSYVAPDGTTVGKTLTVYIAVG